MSPLRMKGDILFQSDFFFRLFFFFVCFFSAKLVRTITFLSFQIGQLYLVCGCMTIRRCVAYHNDLPVFLTSRSNNCFLNSIYLVFGCMTIRPYVAYRIDLHGTLTFDLKVKELFFKLYFLVQAITCLSFEICQLYLVCGCMTIRWCVTFRNDLCETLTFDLKFKYLFLNSIYLVFGCMTIRRCVAYRNDLRGTLTFDLKVK